MHTIRDKKEDAHEHTDTQTREHTRARTFWEHSSNTLGNVPKCLGRNSPKRSGTFPFGGKVLDKHPGRFPILCFSNGALDVLAKQVPKTLGQPASFFWETDF